MTKELDKSGDIVNKLPSTDNVEEAQRIPTPVSIQYEKRKYTHEIITAWAMVIITFVLMSLSFWQAKVMNDGLEETRKMNAETKALAEETIKYARAQTDAVKLSLQYTNSATDAAQRSTRIAELSYETQARPYIGVEDVTIESFEANRKPTYTMTMKNFGSLPAYRATVRAQATTLEPDAGIAIIKEKNFLPYPGSVMIIPAGHSVSITDGFSFELTGDHIRALESREATLYFLAVVEYSGPNNKKYLTEHCSYLDIKTRAVSICSTHNNMK